MGAKNKSVSSSEKSQGGKDKAKKEKKDTSEKKEVAVFINEDEANKIVKSSKVITIQDLARQIPQQMHFLKKQFQKEL